MYKKDLRMKISLKVWTATGYRFLECKGSAQEDQGAAFTVLTNDQDFNHILANRKNLTYTSNTIM